MTNHRPRPRHLPALVIASTMTMARMMTMTVMTVLLACGPAPAPRDPAPDPTSTVTPVTDVPVILALGDSLTAGLGLAQSQAWPTLVQAKLKAAGHRHRVVNAGVSGDTSAGGLARLDWQLSQKPAIVVLELGGNDGLRGLPVAHTRDNLAKTIQRCQAAGATVLLAGMQIPPNMGPDYTAAFRELFPSLAEEFKVPLIPFLLEGVAGDIKLNQRDGIHPTAEGQAIVAETVWKSLQPLLAN